MEGEYRFGEVQVVDMILTVSWHHHALAKATKAGRSRMIPHDPSSDAMSCEPAVEGVGLG